MHLIYNSFLAFKTSLINLNILHLTGPDRAVRTGTMNGLDTLLGCASKLISIDVAGRIRKI